MHMGHFLMISNDNHRPIRVGNEEIMLSKSENFTKILKIMNTMFTNSAVLRPVFSASFQYQREVLLDELLYQLVLFPKVLRNNHYVIFHIIYLSSFYFSLSLFHLLFVLCFFFSKQFGCIFLSLFILLLEFFQIS